MGENRRRVPGLGRVLINRGARAFEQVVLFPGGAWSTSPAAHNSLQSRCNSTIRGQVPACYGLLNGRVPGGSRSRPGASGEMRKFQLVLIKPSHYDDDGYVIRWWRAIVPSNSLAAVYGIAADCAERRILGSDVELDIDIIDETNTRVKIPDLIARPRSNDNFGMIALVGVQSNEYPRALDIARPFRAAGIPVAMGGFHVSGCISMLDGHAVELDACRELGIAMFAGEAEGRLDEVLCDAAAGRLKPLYDFMKDLPGLEGTPVPMLPTA